MNIEIKFEPEMQVKQVIATLEIENMFIDEEFKSKLLKVAKGELTSEQLRQEVIANYV